MKNFSNETKSNRRKGVAVILIYYSFIVWLPLLLCIYYNVGKRIMPFILKNWINYTDYSIWNIMVLIGIGFLFLHILCLLIFIGIVMINDKDINN